jgi:hypothetical protein
VSSWIKPTLDLYSRIQAKIIKRAKATISATIVLIRENRTHAAASFIQNSLQRSG